MSSKTPKTSKTVLFLGASRSVGLWALRATLAAGHRCVALCRAPATLIDAVSPASHPNLRVFQGDARDAKRLAECLSIKGDGTLVDVVVSTIGPQLGMLWTTDDDREVCQRGMAALLEALTLARSEGATGWPLIVACSTTGISSFGRDTPLLVAIYYSVLRRASNEDKREMERLLVRSGEAFCIVRCGILGDGRPGREVGVGVEDPKRGRESAAVGYWIAREEAGRWMATNVVVEDESRYVGKIATITY